MRYVHKFDGTEHEAPAGSLNWPWIPADPDPPIADRLEKVRTAARGHVADTIAEAREVAAAKRGPGRPRKNPEGTPDA